MKFKMYKKYEGSAFEKEITKMYGKDFYQSLLKEIIKKINESCYTHDGIGIPLSIGLYTDFFKKDHSIEAYAGTKDCWNKKLKLYAFEEWGEIDFQSISKKEEKELELLYDELYQVANCIRKSEYLIYKGVIALLKHVCEVEDWYQCEDEELINNIINSTYPPIENDIDPLNRLLFYKGKRYDEDSELLSENGLWYYWDDDKVCEEIEREYKDELELWEKWELSNKKGNCN